MTMKEIRIGDTVQIRRGVCGEGYRFRVSEIVLLLLAGALLVSAVDKLIALDVLPALVDPTWDTSAVLDDSGRVGGLVASLTGYRARPALLPVLALAVYWAVVVTFLRRASR